MFWVELLIVLVMIYWGSRKGGIFLALSGGIGMVLLSCILRVPPSDPPITVILIMIAVIVATSSMQAAGGLDFMVSVAEMILRKNPKYITILAPIVSFVFTMMCGTGHIIYSLLPVINEISIENGVRPERPISASIVSSQQAINACPISAATAALIGYLAVFEGVSLTTVMIITIPATLIGTLAASLIVLKRGKELANDPEYQARVAAGLVKNYQVKKDDKPPVTRNARISVAIFFICIAVIVTMGAVNSFRPTLSNDSKLSMTTIIQMFMLLAAALIVIFCRIDSSKVLEMPVFKTGMFAVVLAFGLCWLVNTFIGDQSKYISENMSTLTNKYPWIFIIATFVVGAITTSQASTTMIMIPIAIALQIPLNIIIAGWLCTSSNYFLPAASQSVAAIAFDSAGTTKIGKFIFNHSYMLPGLTCTVVSVLAALGLGTIIL
jgi:anaerobic C4-dicarboxylate transporter DcuB